MGPTGVWGPHGIKGWWTGHMGQPHHALEGPMRQGLKAQEGRGAGRPNPNPRAAGLGAKPPPAAGPRRGWDAPPLAPYIRRGRGEGAAPKIHPIGALAAPLSNPSRTTSTSSSSAAAWRSPVGSPPYTPCHRRRAADLASLSTNSCGIKNVESSSSCTCGSLGGVARATLG